MTEFHSQFFCYAVTLPEDYRRVIDAMKPPGVKVGCLPFDVNSDLHKNPELRPVSVEKHKVVGAMAVAVPVVIGIETALSATEEFAL